MLAMAVCIGSADATISKSTSIAQKPVRVANIDTAVQQSNHDGVKVESTGRSAKLTAVTVDEPTFVDAKQQLREQLKHKNAAFVQNPDGTITAGFKAVRDGRDVVVSNLQAVWQASFVAGGADPPWLAYMGYYTGYGLFCPAFYYDISLIPAAATIIDVNVDLVITPLGTFPTQPALFDINDLFEIYDDPSKYTAVYNDIMNTSSGNTYATESTGLPVAGTYNYPLGTQAVTDLAAQIAGSETLFGIGLDPSPMSGTDGFWLMDPEQGADPSILYVTYDAPGNAPVITSVTATPATQDNIGYGTITFECTWTDADNQPLEDFGMIFQYRTPWSEEVQLMGGIWEEVSPGSYRWYGEWDPPQDHQIGPHDVRFLIYDQTFTDEWGYAVNDDLFTISSPAVDYEDFNGSSGTGWDPAMTYVVNPPTNTTTGVSWQYGWLWTGTEDYIANVLTDYDSGTGTTWNIAQDCTLTSAAVDCSTAATVHLFFDALYSSNATTPITSFAIEVSTDGFSTIAGTLELTTAVAPDELHILNWDISSYAAGQSNVQVRVHFVAPSTGDANAPNQAIVDVLQLVIGDAVVTVNDTAVTPATAAVIDGGEVTFDIDFTASTTASVDDFQFDIFLQSDVGLPTTLLTGLYNGDAFGTTIVENAPGDFTGSIGGLSFLPGLEIGVYDLMGYATDGIDWDYDDFTDNEDELTLTTPSFWYEDFNDTGATGPAGWQVLSLPGGENGDDWTYDQWYVGGNPIQDWFAVVFYDAEADPQAEALRTAQIDCSTKSNCVLYYYYEWASGFDPSGNASGQIRISGDGGAAGTWNLLYEHTQPATPTIETGLLEFDVSEYADGENDVVIEFNYTATDDYYWMVQIVQINEEIPPPLPAAGPIGLGLLLAAIGGIIVRRRK